MNPDQKTDTLVARLTAIMGEMQRVPKTGWNDHFRYAFATEADVLDAVRPLLVKHGVVLVPSVQRVDVSSVKTRDGEQRLVTLTVRIMATDGIGRLEFDVVGEGADRADKAAAKAMTSAVKAGLQKLFLVATGEEAHPGRPAARPGRGQAATTPPRPTTQARCFAVDAWVKKHGLSRADVGRVIRRLIPDGKPLDLTDAELEAAEQWMALQDARKPAARAEAH